MREMDEDQLNSVLPGESVEAQATGLGRRDSRDQENAESQAPGGLLVVSKTRT